MNTQPRHPKCRALPVEPHPDIHFSAMIPRRTVKIKDFSVCGHLCGQSRFYTAFGNRGKSRKHRRHKALRRFTLPRPGYGHGTPKAGALPTALHPGMIVCFSFVLKMYFLLENRQNHLSTESKVWHWELVRCRFVKDIGQGSREERAS